MRVIVMSIAILMLVNVSPHTPLRRITQFLMVAVVAMLRRDHGIL